MQDPAFPVMPRLRRSASGGPSSALCRDAPFGGGGCSQQGLQALSMGLGGSMLVGWKAGSTIVPNTKRLSAPEHHVVDAGQALSHHVAFATLEVEPQRVVWT